MYFTPLAYNPPKKIQQQKNKKQKKKKPAYITVGQTLAN